eukprot:gene3720-4132_t
MIDVSASFGPGNFDPGCVNNTVTGNVFLYSASYQQNPNTSIFGSAVPLPPAYAIKELSGGVASNLYYNEANPDGKPLFSQSGQQFLNYSWTQWRQLGLDAQSLQGTDPLFVSPRMDGESAGDWRLLPNSPAAGI